MKKVTYDFFPQTPRIYMSCMRRLMVVIKNISVFVIYISASQRLMILHLSSIMCITCMNLNKILLFYHVNLESKNNCIYILSIDIFLDSCHLLTKCYFGIWRDTERTLHVSSVRYTIIDMISISSNENDFRINMRKVSNHKALLHTMSDFKIASCDFHSFCMT